MSTGQTSQHFPANLNPGDKVVVIGQPPQIGTVEAISTWRIVNGVPNDDPCYLVSVQSWTTTHTVNAGWLAVSSKSISRIEVQNEH